MEPKLGDFGLSRMGQLEVDPGTGEEAECRKPMIASHIKGTLAYLPPEFTSHRIFTTKLDVYSFGNDVTVKIIYIKIQYPCHHILLNII
jgi:serine/threonine protein kinase